MKTNNHSRQTISLRGLALFAWVVAILCATPSPLFSQFPSGVDTNFNPVLENVVDGINEAPFVLVVHVQTNGGILIAGQFTAVNGISRPGLARLNSDGSLDASFAPPATLDAYVQALRSQSSGKVIIRGYFSTVDGVARPGVARLNLDGSLDSSFAPTAPELGGEGNTFDVQADDKVILYPTRLNADGTTDETYSPESFGGTVFCAVLQSSGKLLVGGNFRAFYFVGETFVDTDALIRLNSNGSIDGTFEPVFPGRHATVESMIVQKNNDAIYINGSFVSIHGAPRSTSARLNANGSLDTGWLTPIELESTLSPYFGAAQNNGKLIAYYRFNNNGSLDTSFNIPNEDGYIASVALQPNGRILVGGDFTTIDHAPRTGLAQLYGDAPTPSALTLSATNLTGASATLRGTVAANGAPTTAHFDYGTTLTYGNSTAEINVGSGAETIAVSNVVTGLSPATTYHFRLVASNSGGTNLGDDQIFTTSAGLLAPMLVLPAKQDGQFSLSVVTVSGPTYYLERSTSLSASNWATVATVPGNGLVRSLADLSATNSQSFYRVRIE